MSHLPFQTTRTRTKVLCFCEKYNNLLVDPKTKAKYMSKYNAKIYFNNNNYQEAGPSNAEPSNTDDDDFYNDMSKYTLEAGPSGPSNVKTSDNFHNEIECDKITDQLLFVSLSGSNYFFLTKVI